MPQFHRLHYAWVIVAVTFAATIMVAGVRATPTVLIVPYKEEFHWSLATISFAVSINLLLYGAVGPFAAAIIERFGARRTITLALATTAAAVALTPAMSQAWQLIALWGVVVGLSTGFVGAYLSAFIAARWFAKREGLVVGILTAGFAAGQLVFLPTMATLATNGGWRFASLVLAEAGCSPRRQPGDGGVSRACHRYAFARFLADRRGLFCLRGHNQWADRHSFDPGLHRSRAERGGRCGPARCYRRLRADRWDRLGLAQRPLRQSHPAVLLLRVSRSCAALPALRFRYVVLWPVIVQHGLWTRLDRRRAADGAAYEGRRRHRADRHHDRLDHRDPSDRQRLGRLFRRRPPQRLRHLFRSLHRLRNAVDRGGGDGAVHRRRPRPRAGGRARHRDLTCPAHSGGAPACVESRIMLSAAAR